MSQVKQKLRLPTVYLFVREDKILGRYISKEEELFTAKDVLKYRDVNYTDCDVYVRVRE